MAYLYIFRNFCPHLTLANLLPATHVSFQKAKGVDKDVLKRIARITFWKYIFTSCQRWMLDIARVKDKAKNVLKTFSHIRAVFAKQLRIGKVYWKDRKKVGENQRSKIIKISKWNDAVSTVKRFRHLIIFELYSGIILRNVSRHEGFVASRHAYVRFSANLISSMCVPCGRFEINFEIIFKTYYNFGISRSATCHTVSVWFMKVNIIPFNNVRSKSVTASCFQQRRRLIVRVSLRS